MPSILKPYFQLFSYVSHHNFQLNRSRSIIIILIQFLMRIALLFPYSPWPQQNQISNQPLIYIQTILKQFNLHTLLKQQDIQMIDYLICYFISYLHLIFLITFIVLSQLVQKSKLKRVQFTPLLIHFHTYINELRFFYLLPTIISLFYLIFERKGTEQYINLVMMILPSIAFLIQIIVTLFFLRKNTFNNINILASNFTYLQVLSLLIEISISLLQFHSHEIFYDYLRLCLIETHHILILLIDLIYGCSIQLFWKLHLIQFILSTMLLIFVLSEGKWIVEEDILYLNFLLITFILSIGNEIWEIRNRYLMKINLSQSDEQFIIENAQQLLNCKKETLKAQIKIQFHFENCKSLRCKKNQQEISIIMNEDQLKKQIKLIILCSFQTTIQIKKINCNSSDFIRLIITYITFLTYECKSPLIAYLELKDYYGIDDLYFKFIYNELSEEIIQQIIEAQTEYEIELKLRNEEKTIEIKDLTWNTSLEEKFIPIILQIVELKYIYWLKLTKGLQDLNEFLELTLELTNKMQICFKLIQSEIKIDVEKVNWQTQCSQLIYQLRLLQLFYAFVMNDQNNCYQIELFIDETLRYERQLSTEKILNISLIEDEVILIYVSIGKHRGIIKNKERKQIAKFFAFTDEMEFKEIQHINQLMPSFFSIRHDNIVDEFLLRGNSKLFNINRKVFFQNRKKFIECSNLKLDNCFISEDDYQMIGSLIKINKSKQYILFDEEGKIFGITEEIMTTIFKHESIYKIISSAYAFLILPQLAAILDNQKDAFTQQNEKNLEDKLIYLNVCKNFSKLLDLYNSYSIDVDTLKKSLKERKNFERFDIANKRILNRNQKSSKQNNQSLLDSFKKTLEIPLLKESFQQSLLNFFLQPSVKSILDDFQSFQAKGNISLSFMQESQNKKPFFIFEISDYQEKKVTFSGSKFFQSFYSNSANKHISTDFGIDESKFQKVEIDSSNTSLIHQENQFEKIVSQVTQMNITEKDLGKKENELMNCGLIPATYGPLSQRANFIQIPVNQSNVISDEIKDFEQDFKELLQIQSFKNSQNYFKDYLGEIGDNNLIEEENIIQDVIKSSSQILNQKNNILQILQQNQQQQVEIQNDEVGQIKGSQTSTKTNSTQTQGMNIVKNFQKNKKYIPTLVKIITINTLLFFIFISFITTSMMLYQQSYNQIWQNVDDISSPILLNLSFSKTLIYSWYELFLFFNIINYSDYVTNRFYNDTLDLSHINFDRLNSLYPIFFNVEKRNLLPVIELYFMNGMHDPNVAFTKFYIILQEKQQFIFKWITKNDTSKKVNQEVIDDIFFFRSNYLSCVKLTSTLVRKLDEIFFQTIDYLQNEQLLLLIAQIATILFVIISQLYFWDQITKYEEKMLLMMVRLYEKDVNIIQARLLVVKEILLNQSRRSWKQCNFYLIGFCQLSSEILTNLGVMNKQLNSLITNQNDISFNMNNPAGQKKQKRGGSTVLSTRILKTFLSQNRIRIIIVLLLFLLSFYLIGGFLFYYEQQIQIKPTQQLLSQYLIFAQDLDYLICIGILMKTQFILKSKIEEVQLQIPIGGKLQQTDELLEMFIQLSGSYDKQIYEIFSSILKSKKIEDNQKEELYQLYEANFCLVIRDMLPFCQLQELQKEKFIKKYGNFNDTDNNYEYLEKGILGIASYVQKFINEQFHEEISSHQYVSNEDQLKALIQKQQFINVFLEHFFDTKKGLILFKELILNATRTIMENDLKLLYTYEILVGIIIALIFSITMYLKIKNSQKEIQLLRIGLSNIPIEILNDPQTISQLKRLENY